MSLLNLLPLLGKQYGRLRLQFLTLDYLVILGSFIAACILITDLVRASIIGILRDIAYLPHFYMIGNFPYEIGNILYDDLGPIGTLTALTFIFSWILLYILNQFWFHIWARFHAERLNDCPHRIYQRRDWYIENNSEVSREAESIILSETWGGILYKKFIAKNFQLEFDFIPKPSGDRTIGILFRAQNLDDYFMLQISEDFQSTKSCFTIRLSTRVSGLFRGPEPKFSKKLTVVNPDSTKHFKVRLTGTEINVEIGGQTTNITLPDAIQNDKATPQQILGLLPQSTLRHIYFRNSHGLIGFRATGYEGGTITNLKLNLHRHR